MHMPMMENDNQMLSCRIFIGYFWCWLSKYLQNASLYVY